MAAERIEINIIERVRIAIKPAKGWWKLIRTTTETVGLAADKKDAVQWAREIIQKEVSQDIR